MAASFSSPTPNSYLLTPVIKTMARRLETKRLMPEAPVTNRIVLGGTPERAIALLVPKNPPVAAMPTPAVFLLAVFHDTPVAYL
jgi:hypothetical protein